MQSYPLELPEQNMTTQIRSWLTKWTEGKRRDMATLAYQRDPDSIFDELLIGIQVLLVTAVLFTIGFGVYYHYNVFQLAFGIGTLSVVGSFVLFVILEICKVVFGLHLARAILSNLWYKSIYRFLFTCGLVIIVGFAYKWSIGISTKGIAQVSTNLKSSKIYRSKSFAPSPAIDSIDAQIARFEKAKTAGSKSTYHGRTTKGGIKVIQSNTDLQKLLMEQRESLLASERSQHDSLTTLLVDEVKLTSATLMDYGGKAEYASMLFILLWVLLEFINYDKNAAKLAVATNGETEKKP